MVDIGSSTATANEDAGPFSLEICLSLVGVGGTSEIQDDVVVPLMIVDGKAGMLNPGLLQGYHSP